MNWNISRCSGNLSSSDGDTFYTIVKCLTWTWRSMAFVGRKILLSSLIAISTFLKVSTSSLNEFLPMSLHTTISEFLLLCEDFRRLSQAQVSTLDLWFSTKVYPLRIFIVSWWEGLSCAKLYRVDFIFSSKLACPNSSLWRSAIELLCIAAFCLCWPKDPVDHDTICLKPESMVFII